MNLHGPGSVLGPGSIMNPSSMLGPGSLVGHSNAPHSKPVRIITSQLLLQAWR